MGKNFLPLTYTDTGIVVDANGKSTGINGKEMNGITFWVKPDCCIEVNGTATATATFKLCDIKLPINKTIYLSGCP
jgi:hypothetical protein